MGASAGVTRWAAASWLGPENSSGRSGGNTGFPDARMRSILQGGRVLPQITHLRAVPSGVGHRMPSAFQQPASRVGPSHQRPQTAGRRALAAVRWQEGGWCPDSTHCCDILQAGSLSRTLADNVPSNSFGPTEILDGSQFRRSRLHGLPQVVLGTRFCSQPPRTWSFAGSCPLSVTST